MGNYDSAYVSLNKALMADNQYTRRTVYQHFCYLFEEQGDYKKAVEYNKRYWACNDSIQNAESDIILDIETKYLREKLLAEKQQFPEAERRLFRRRHARRRRVFGA